MTPTEIKYTLDAISAFNQFASEEKFQKLYGESEGARYWKQFLLSKKDIMDLYEGMPPQNKRLIAQAIAEYAESFRQIEQES
jgi:hypothetical protein